jgi:hypothetical protein
MGKLLAWLRRRRPCEPYWKPEYELLAQYNAERARGVVHSEEYANRMAVVQADYDVLYLPALHDYLNS